MTAATTLTATRHLLRHQIMRTRRAWWSVIFSGLAQPTLFLLAIGAGIGSQIDDAELAALGADSYMAWIGPGILAVTAMQMGATEAMWPTMGLLKWQGTYRALLRTPMGLDELSVAHLVWIAFRAFVTAVCFLAVLVITGVTTSLWAIAVPFVAGLIAIVHGAPIAARTAAVERDDSFPVISRLIIFPMFIFSGAFFPVDEMPGAVAAIARVVPSWHGVQLARHLASGALTTHTLGHLALLIVVAAFGVLIARRSFVNNVDA